MKAYQERLITLLKDTITLLCRNGLEYDQQFCVEGLLGVTLDKDKEVFLIPIKELITDKGVGTDDGVPLEADQEQASDTDADITSVKAEHSSSRKRRRHKHHHSPVIGDGGGGRGDDEGGTTNFDTAPAEWNTDATDLDNTRDSSSNQPDDSSTKRRRHADPIDIKSEDVVVIKEEIDDQEFASAFHDSSLDGSSLQNRDGNSMDYFSQPGTSSQQGPLGGFSMDQMAATGTDQGMLPGMMGSQDGDGSWLQNPGDMTQQQSQEWQQQKHQQNSIKKKGVDCELCGQVFTTKGNLQRHRLGVHMKVRYSCDVCGKEYSQMVHVQRHKKMNHF